MSDTSIKQFFYLAAKNLFGLKISREEFEQSKNENFDLSENLKSMFNKQSGKIINTDNLSAVSGKNQFIERENYNKELNSNAYAYNYVTHFAPSVGQTVNPKSQISDLTASTTSNSNSDEKRIFNDLEDHASNILNQTPQTTSVPDTLQETPSIPIQTPRVQTQQQQPITSTDSEEKKEDTQNSDVESPKFTAEDNSPSETKSAVNYYKSLVNNIFPGYFDMDSEGLGYNMEGGENEIVESQKAPINWEAKAYQTAQPQQPQPPITETTKQDNINLDDKITGNFTSENSPKEDSILDPKSAKHYYKSLVNNIYPGYFNMNSDSSESIMEGGENESNQISIEKPQEIKKTPETEKEFEDKIITTEEKKQQENIIIVNPDEIKEKPKDNINVIPSFNETQKQEKEEKQENKTPIPSFLESNIMKGGELPPESSISQNTQNIILNAFNELTDKKKNNLF